MAEYALPQLPTLFGVEDALFEEGDLPEDQLIQRQQDAHRRRVAAIFEAYQDSPTPEGECDYRIEFRSSSKSRDFIDSDIEVQLFGSAFYSQVHTITCSMMAKNISIVSNDIEEHATKSITKYFIQVHDVDIGDLVAVSVGHDSTGDKRSWFLDSIVVQKIVIARTVTAVTWEAPSLQQYSRVLSDRATHRVHYAHNVTPKDEERVSVSVTTDTVLCRDPKNNKKYVKYRVDCESGSLRWTMYLRYSHLHDTQERLRRKFPQTETICKAFPDKKFITSSVTPAAVEERRLGFQTWFNSMLELPEILRSRDMRALLEIPPNQLRVYLPRRRTVTASAQVQLATSTSSSSSSSSSSSAQPTSTEEASVAPQTVASDASVPEEVVAPAEQQGSPTNEAE